MPVHLWAARNCHFAPDVNCARAEADRHGHHAATRPPTSPRRSNRSRWADEIVVVDSESTRRHRRRSRGATPIASSCGRGPATSRRRTSRPSRRSHDWILSLDADERVSPELADEIRDAAGGAPAAAGYRIPRVTFHLGRWIRSTDWYPDYQLRLYDRRRARWAGRYVHESVQRRRAVSTSARRAAALRVSRSRRITCRRWIATRRWRRGRCSRTAGAPAGSTSSIHPRLAFFRNYILRGGFRDGMPGLDRFGDERVLRRPQIREALGAVFALHIDTARTWRGGQNQVLLTVLGPARARAPGRARRAPGGRALSPRARRARSGAARAAQRGRSVDRVEAVAHHPPMEAARSCTRTIRMPSPWRPGAVVRRARPAAARSSRRGGSTSTCRRTRSRAGSTGRWICSSPRPTPSATCSSTTAFRRRGSSSCTTASTSRKIERLPAVDVHAEYWLPHGAPVIANVGALVGHKGQKHLIDAMPHVLREVPDAHADHLRRRRAARAARAADQGSAPREARAAGRAFARMCCSW